MEYRPGISPDTVVYMTEKTSLREAKFSLEAALLAMNAGTLVKIEIIEN